MASGYASIATRIVACRRKVGKPINIGYTPRTAARGSSPTRQIKMDLAEHDGKARHEEGGVTERDQPGVSAQQVHDRPNIAQTGTSVITSCNRRWSRSAIPRHRRVKTKMGCSDRHPRIIMSSDHAPEEALRTEKMSEKHDEDRGVLQLRREDQRRHLLDQPIVMRPRRRR